MPPIESTTFGHDITENTDMTSEFGSLPSVIKILTPVLEQLNKKMSIVADKYEKLADLDASLIEFNQSFGCFLSGMQTSNETMDWKYAPTDLLIKKYNEQKQAKTVHDTLHHNEPVKTSAPVASSARTENTNKTKKRTAPLQKSQQSAKKKKTVSKSQINRIIENLPELYRGRTDENEQMKKMLEALIQKPDGLTRKELVKVTDLAQRKVIDCLKVLCHCKVAISKQVQGEYNTFCLV